MDAYDRKARLYPAACVIFPCTFFAAACASLPSWWTGLAALAAAAGLHVPVVLAVRDLGAGEQPGLWKSWGGAPTMVRMRWSSTENDMLHQARLGDIERATGIVMPSRVREAADPAAADQAYEAAAERLRHMTRDEDQFPLVKVELTNYGYRRNLYGCRHLGALTAAAMTVLETVALILCTLDYLQLSVGLVILSLAVSLACLAAWRFVVTSEFVRRDADRYASALINAASSLPPVR